MERRVFLKKSCKICLLGTAGFAVVLEACSPKAGITLADAKSVIVKDSIATVPLSALKNNSPLTILTIPKYPYEIAIEKMENNNYRTLLLMCTHYENQLIPTGNGYTCSAHGSKFTKEGKVLNGPAALPLKELKTIVSETNLFIQLI